MTYPKAKTLFLKVTKLLQVKEDQVKGFLIIKVFNF